MKKGLPKEKTIEIPASIWKRAVAFIIDIAILEFVVVYPFRKLFLSEVPSGTITEVAKFLEQNPAMMNTLNLVILAVSLLMLLYFSIMEYKFQQTVGKMLMKISVQKKGLVFWKCIVRNLFFIMFFPFILLWIIEPFFILFTKEHQRALELLTKTKTVEQYKI